VYNEIKVLILALCLPQTIRFIRRVRDMNLAPLRTEKVPQSDGGDARALSQLYQSRVGFAAYLPCLCFRADVV
jgi:hypothetical protein